MLRKFALCGVLVFLCSVSSYSIAGFGFTYAPNPMAELDATSESFTVIPDIQMVREKASGLFGIGGKVWVDALPVIDLEASGYVQFLRYDVTLKTPVGDESLRFSSGLPGVPDAQPAFGKVVGDISVLYPFLKFPPVVSIAKFYVGAGLSYVASTRVLDKELMEKVLDKTVEDNADLKTAGNFDNNAKEALAKSVIKTFEKEGLESGVGAHLTAGVKIKPPIVPIAVFADVKYHIGGNLPSEVSNGLTLEIGGGLAF